LNHFISDPAYTGRVVVTWIDFDPEDPATGGLLREAGLSVDLQPKDGARSPSELIEVVKGAIAAIVSTDPFDASVFAAAPELRTISRVGVGTDSIDLEAATEARVAVTVTPGANEQTTADHTLALMLAAIRRITEHDASVRRGRWDRAGELTAWELNGKTVGLVGYGRIGKAVGQRLRGFNVRLLATDPALEALDGPELVPLDELLGRADIVSLHAPLTEETRGMLDGKRLALMPEQAILVNTARGPLVDEAALIEALEKRSIRAAALDVFADEPPADSRLLRLDNVVASPHIGGLSDRSIAEMTRRATQNVLDVLDGQVSDAVVNPEALGSSGRSQAASEAAG
jgi:phosphoglycerate dehydrogenase-like enzyme